MTDSLRGVAVGGDYLQPTDTTRSACFTTDGGQTWQLPKTFPGRVPLGRRLSPRNRSATHRWPLRF